VAWLSLDAGESDPAQFLRALVAALQTLAASLGAAAAGALRSPQPPPTEAVLTSLLNDLTALANPVVLVLDDYHLIDAAAVDLAVSFLLEHLPLTLHLVIATREDPQFSLARFRAQAELTELRAADLRFTADEAADFLGRVMGLSLSGADVAALEDRTEGWIAGLQLAALSMRGRGDLPGFIRGFAGDHRFVVDYLVQEVLQRQPEPVRRFLLHTSVLERLSGPLCDAVTGQGGGAAQLAALERGNFFVTALDDRRHWYRYHPLFADVLSAQLRSEQPDQVAELHRRASDWYDQAGFTTEAVQHALAAEAFGRAAELVEQALPALRRSRQEARALSWLRRLPNEVMRVRPVLCVHHAGALLLAGDLEGARARLRDAEVWLGQADEQPGPAGGEMVVIDEAEFQGLAGSVAIFRAGLALAVGDVAGTTDYARQVLALVPEDDHLRRGSAAGFLGLADWTLGDLEAAHGWYSECMNRLEQAEYLSDATGCAIALGALRITQGRLTEALSIYERGLRLATAPDGPALRGAADMHVGLSELCCERGDLEAAAAHLARSQALGAFGGLPQNAYRFQVATARLLEAQGDPGGALLRLGEAERVYTADFFPDVRPIAALKARLWIRQARWGDALGWVRQQGLTAQDDLSYRREFEHLTLARLLLARSVSGAVAPEVTGLLERLLRAAQDGGRTGSVIEILVLQALASQMRGELPEALLRLGDALALAEPEGYVRMFIDEGPAMTALLRQAAQRGLAPDYIHRLLSAAGPAGAAPPVARGSFESLSERELEVLRLLGSELSGPELARHFGVSLNTLRTHTKNIYSKLGVGNRRAAVRRAEELGLC
jgi:LuxR family transcriptional regulator, maltose regulon positive regulatory protein